MIFERPKKAFDPYLLATVILAGVFFLLYSWLSYFTTQQSAERIIFNSPDETANYWSSQHFFTQGNFLEFSQASLIGEDIVKPRSFRIINNYLLPVGFLGLPWLYGLIASLFNSAGLIVYLTPLLAAGGIIFLYLLLRNIWGREVAFLGSILGFIVPGYWYYASKAMMPNVLFLSLLLIGLYFFSQAIKNRRLLNYLLAGLLLGLALLVRPAEIIWIAPLLIFTSLYFYRRINWAYIWLVPIVGLAAALPMFYHNIILFGQPWDVGYQLTAAAGSQPSGILRYLLPFGFDWEVIRYNVVNYLYNLFPEQAWLILVGTGLFVFFSLRERKKSNFAYLFLIIILSLLLVVYYGSWQFSDNPNPRLITIGTSFVRYWLPLYFFALPLIAYGVTRLFRSARRAWLLVVVALFCFNFVISANLIYRDKQEGLLAVARNLQIYQQSAAQVAEQIEPEAIIVAKKQDKVFFPEWTVVYDLFYDIDYARVRHLLDYYSVYVWDFRRSTDNLAYTNATIYQPQKLILIPTGLTYNNMQLYKLNDYR